MGIIIMEEIAKERKTRMLNREGFDLWADGYDRSVGLSDEDGSYPFAGYRDILNAIYGRILSDGGRDVLDVGFGTGVLAARLYQQGCRIYGQDFSPRMIELAREKMPEAELVQGNFTLGVAEPLTRRRYDAIVATYSLHHLTDAQKPGFIRSLTALLREGGRLYIGDVAFETRAELEACRARAGEEWDSDEAYFVCGELRAFFPELKFEKFSDCAGLLTLEHQDG